MPLTQEPLTKRLAALLKEKSDKRLEMCHLERKIDGAALAYWSDVYGLQIGGLIRWEGWVFQIESLKADGSPMGKPLASCSRWLESTKRWSKLKAYFDRLDHYEVLSQEEADAFFLALRPKAKP